MKKECPKKTLLQSVNNQVLKQTFPKMKMVYLWIPTRATSKLLKLRYRSKEAELPSAKESKIPNCLK